MKNSFLIIQGGSKARNSTTTSSHIQVNILGQDVQYVEVKSVVYSSNKRSEGCETLDVS